MARFHQERFDVSTEFAGRGGEVRFVDAKVCASSNGSTSLLDLAESVGVPIPSACRTGHCGECKVRCLSGPVLSTCRDGLSEEEVAAGYVLSCVATADGDVSLAV
jgi:ferredoxin